MLPFVILGAAVLAGTFLLLSAFAQADVQALARGLRRSGPVLGAVAAAALFLWLVASGRIGSILALAPVLLPALPLLRRGLRRAKAERGPRPGQRSEVRTRYLRAELDHDTGALDGEVLEGPLQGRRLGDLSLRDLLALLRECQREEAPSAAILEAYLDRRFPEWRSAEAGPATAAGGMSREEAYEILGLKPGATPEEIRQAHRRLMLMMHPDRGGSTYLAARINEAKDVLTET